MKTKAFSVSILKGGKDKRECEDKSDLQLLRLLLDLLSFLLLGGNELLSPLHFHLRRQMSLFTFPPHATGKVNLHFH